ncbi:anti-sigma factor [Micromonospora vulcania]|uniref:Anti-sigma factor n=1 Tax=Micromonospora vulcania TaxID=1441873 RepID=A0ABW1H6J4_9ACTN
MQHLDHDRLVFLALGESEADNGESTHLDVCAHCRTEFATLRQVAGLGADTKGLADLPDPPEHVWQGIVAEIRAADDLPTESTDRVPRQPTRANAASAGRVRPRGRWSRWAGTAVIAAAAAAVGVLGTVAVLGPDDPAPAPTRAVVASTPLVAYGSTPPTANGDARVFQGGQLHLHVANLPRVAGYYEVWLINPTTMQMFSVGTLGDGPDALLPLPPNVDLRTYSVVDVSAERYDNKPAHSGDSLLRGTLTG